MTVRCRCCSHRMNDHLDEGGDYIGCWPCETERNRTRERAWGAGPLRRWLHRVLGHHTWYTNPLMGRSCVKCGLVTER